MIWIYSYIKINLNTDRLSILKAVVVDDEKDIAQMISELLELQNLKIVGIGYTGIDAIRLVKKQKPDIVFLDISMPEMNGVEALIKIKKYSPSTSAILITGDLQVDVKNLMQRGALSVIFKPFDLPTIMGVIDKIKGKIDYQ